MRIFHNIATVSAGVLCLGLGAAQAATYSVIDLGASAGWTHLANNGDAVGFTNATSQVTTLHRDGGTGAINTQTVATDGWQATDINFSGQMSATRYSFRDNRAYLWDPVAGLTDIGSLPGWRLSATASRINASGQISGVADTLSGTTRAEHAYIWDATSGMTDLTPVDQGYYQMSTVALSDSGLVTGTGQGSGGAVAEAYLWSPTAGYVKLGDLPEGRDRSFAASVNESGQVVGNSSAEGSQPRAFLWDELTGMIELSGLPTGAFKSWAYDLNDAGQVVGEYQDKFGLHPFLWTAATGMVEIDSRLDPTAGWTFAASVDINDRGDILGTAYDSTGALRSVILSAAVSTVPLPAAGLLLLAGLAGLGTLRPSRKSAPDRALG